MNRNSLSMFFALAVISFMRVTHAQTPQAANPLDAVPEKLPFDTPYGPPILLEQADRVLAAALNEAKNRTWKMVCSIVDSGGNLLLLKRMDGAQLASIDISIHKGRTAVKFRRETKVFESAVQSGSVYQTTIDDVIAARGGIPLVTDGKLIGAIGCSGGSGSQDEVVAKAGITALTTAK